MAKILDSLNIQRRRFTKWAEEWLKIPSEAYHRGFIRETYIKDIIAVLLENKVFTLAEIREEFRRNKIYIPESIIQSAFIEVSRRSRNER